MDSYPNFMQYMEDLFFKTAVIPEQKESKLLRLFNKLSSEEQKRHIEEMKEKIAVYLWLKDKEAN